MPSREAEPGSRGFIVPIGGAEDQISNRAILRRVADLCGGAAARIAVIPTASVLPDTGSRYVDVFRAVGAGSVVVVPVVAREEAESDDMLDLLEGCTGIFLTGGNQLRLSTILGGTALAQRIRRMNARGVHVAGTSAGAAFSSDHMIAFGESGSTPRAGGVSLAPGLGLINRIIVDQHFRQRDRLGRLLTALSYNPFTIGCGLDEDTAAFIGPDDVLEVVGSGGITIVDVSALEYSSMAEARPGQPVELIGVRLHVLSEGARFDLSRRKATPAPVKPSLD
jgi:cyanophycinase